MNIVARAGVPSAVTLANPLLLFVAVGLQFQFVVPIGASGLKVCPADLVAIVGAALVITLSIRDRCPVLNKDINRSVFLLPTYALTLGLTVAYYRYGNVSSWALVSKYVGWFVLLAYLITAAGLVARGHNGLLATSLRLFSWLTVIVNATFYIPRFLYILYIPAPGVLNFIALWKLRIYGDQQSSPVGNDNGSAVMLICVLAIIFGDRAKSSSVFTNVTACALASVACGTIIMTGSRAGMAAAALLIIISVMIGSSARKLAFVVVAISGLFLGVAQLAGVAGVNDVGNTEDRALPYRNRAEGDAYDASITGRLETYKAALNIAKEYPVFGGGLGAFLVGQNQNALIIHNSFLWILAEMGVVGVAAYLLFFVALARYLIKAARTSDIYATSATTALLILVSVGAMAMAHELLYQRAPWFLIGLALAANAGAPDPLVRNIKSR